MLVAMSLPERSPATVRARREPPRFRLVAVRRVVHMTPRMVRVTLTGCELEGLTVEHPAASVRLLLPSPGAQELVIPSWHGNEFLLPDGRRPAIRTFTPRLVDSEPLELAVATRGDALVAAVCGADVAPRTRLWAAGEAAAVQRIRRHLFVDRGLPRAHATVRGYWKHGRSADAENDA